MDELTTERKKRRTAWRVDRRYLAEAALIVFSVLLALLLNEIRSNWQDSQETRKVLRNVRLELIKNKAELEDQYQYHRSVLHNIDSALTHEAYKRQLLGANGEFYLLRIAPEGVGLNDMDEAAWEVAKNQDIYSSVDMETISLLTNIALEQVRIRKIEDEVAKIFLDRDSRKPENMSESLVLMRDAYHGWAVDRVPELLETYDAAIARLDAYK